MRARSRAADRITPNRHLSGRPSPAALCGIVDSNCPIRRVIAQTAVSFRHGRGAGRTNQSSKVDDMRDLPYRETKAVAVPSRTMDLSDRHLYFLSMPLRSGSVV